MYPNSPNPFVVGTPVAPEKFIGRKSVIQTAFDQIHSRCHLAVWGGLGIGKTSFLTKIACPDTWIQNGQDPSSAVIVRFSCEEIEPCFSPSGFWTKVLSLLKVNLHTEPELQEQVNTLLGQGQASRDNLRQVLGELRRKQKLLVLLIDDYDIALAEHQEYSDENMQRFLSECRNLAVHAEGERNLSIIVTSKKRLNDISPRLNPNQSPWYNHYLFRQLKPFDNTEIEQILKPFNKPITTELRQALGEIAGGHPTLLQNAGFYLYRVSQTEDFINDFERNTQPFFDIFWQRCNSKEQNLLMLMALSKLRGRLHQRRRYDLTDIELILTQNDRILNSLEEQGVIKGVLNNGNKTFIFTSSLMEKWVIQEIWNSNDDSLIQRQKEFLNLMSHQQSENMKNAIVWIGKNKDDVISSLKFVYPIIEKIIKFFIV